MSRGLDDVVAELYAGPREDFISGRKRIAAGIDPSDAESVRWVKGLKKPTVLAWAVNRLRAEHRGTFDHLISSGGALRAALQKGDPASAMTDRRAAVDAALERIDAAWRVSGKELAVSQRRTLASTLEALSVGIESAALEDGLKGRLAKDLSPPGIESLAGLVIASQGAPHRVRAASGAAARKTAGRTEAGGNASSSASAKTTAQQFQQQRKELTAARRRESRSQKALDKLEVEGETARSRVQEVQALLAEVRAARAELRGRIEKARGELRRAERDTSKLERFTSPES